VHNHLGNVTSKYNLLTAEKAKKYLEAMDAAGVATVINLDGAWDDTLKGTLEILDNTYPTRFQTFALINFSDFDDPDWSERETKRLKRGFEMGAKGLKIPKDLGLTYKHKDGTLVKIDDAKIDPLWALCGEYKKPIMIHISDPAAFFTPLDKNNERWHELNKHPNWLFADREKFPTRSELHEARNRVMERHPKTTFIGAHMGNNPEDLETVGKWLDKYPNFHIDIDARISELGRQPFTSRKFIIKYQDRVMFGTDTPAKIEAFRIYFRFLETEDEYFDCTESHHQQGFWMIYGINLPKDVLEKVYRTNALKLLKIPEAKEGK
jgi:predicted TIM-barrel fold metal-dependent hydrolase